MRLSINPINICLKEPVWKKAYPILSLFFVQFYILTSCKGAAYPDENSWHKRNAQIQNNILPINPD